MSIPNIQDDFLNKLKKSQQSVAVITTNGYQSKGRIVDFDTFTILMDVNGKQQLVYKSAVSTIKGV